MYEVADSVIPPEGRDVQCSACGKVWFQLPAIPRHTRPELDLTYASTKAEAASAGVEDEDESLFEPPSALGGDVEKSPPEARIDRKVLEVLREEAARELAARRGRSAAQAPAPEEREEAPAPNNPEPGAHPVRPRRRPADMQGALAVAKAPAPPPSRRSLLPDIDAISSEIESAGASLLSPPRGEGAQSSDRARAQVESVPRSRLTAFGRAGLYGLTAVLVLVALYFAADPLAELVPALAKALQGYVSAIDRAVAFVAALLVNSEGGGGLGR